MHVEKPLLIEASAVSFKQSDFPDDKDTLHDDVHIVSGDTRSCVCVHDVKKGKASLLGESKSGQPTCKAAGLDIGLRLMAGVVKKSLRDESADLKRHVAPESETLDPELKPIIKNKRKTTITHPPSAQLDPISRDGHQHQNKREEAKSVNTAAASRNARSAAGPP